MYSRISNFLKSFPPIFIISLLISGVIFLIGFVYPEKFVELTVAINTKITDVFGNFYLILTFFCLLLLIGVAVSPLGKIRLGGEEAKPEHSFLSWVSMLFCAGMGVGILFWGAAEPLFHFLNPPLAGSGMDKESIMTAIHFTLFHWGFHPWAIYGIVAMVVGFFVFNRKKRMFFSEFIRIKFPEKLIKCRKKAKFLGNVRRGTQFTIDQVTVLAVLFGIVASFGSGVLQIEGGLKEVFGIEPTFLLQVGIIALSTVFYLISSFTGLSRGIKYLSNISMSMCILLLILVIFATPASGLLVDLLLSAPAFFAKLIPMSFGNMPFADPYWVKDWTIKYWSWWIAWAPFVGGFIALISRGRTIRELAIAVMVIPTSFSYIWFIAFGTSAIGLHMAEPLVALPFGFDQTNLVLFNLLERLNLPGIVSILSIFTISVFFINSADSATYTLASMSAKKIKGEPPVVLKFAWGILFAAMACVFLFSGGIYILQQVTLITVLPYAFIFLFVIFNALHSLVTYHLEMNSVNKDEEEESSLDGCLT